MKKRLIFFVEDPGAANYIVPVIKQAVRNSDFEIYLIADGIARSVLASLMIPYSESRTLTSADEAIAGIKPDLLLLGTSENRDSFGLALIDAAREKGVTSIAAVDAAMNSAKRFCGRTTNPLAHFPDWILLPDEGAKREFIEIGATKERMVVCGHPHYDHLAELKEMFDSEGVNTIRTELFGSLPAAKKILVFVSEGSARICETYRINHSEFTFAGRGRTAGRTEIVLEEFLDAIAPFRDSLHVVFRMHPKDLKEDYTQYYHEFDDISSGGNPLKLLCAADLVVGMTSMSLLEAILLGRPSLAIIPRNIEKTWLPGVRDDLIPCVTNREELHKALADILTDEMSMPVKDGVVIFGALPRIMSFIDNVLSETM